MEKQEIISRQATLVRLEAIEKQLKALQETQAGLIKRFKQGAPKSSNLKLILCSLVSLACGVGAGLFF